MRQHPINVDDERLRLGKPPTGDKAFHTPKHLVAVVKQIEQHQRNQHHVAHDGQHRVAACAQVLPDGNGGVAFTTIARSGQQIAQMWQIQVDAKPKNGQLRLQPGIQRGKQRRNFRLELRTFGLDDGEHQRNEQRRHRGKAQDHRQRGDPAGQSPTRQPLHPRLQHVGDQRAQQERGQHRPQCPHEDTDCKRDKAPQPGLAAYQSGHQCSR